MAYDPYYDRKVRSPKAIIGERYEDRGWGDSTSTQTWQQDGIDFSLKNPQKSHISQEGFDDLMSTLARLALQENSDKLAMMFFDCKQQFANSLSQTEEMEAVERELWTLATGEELDHTHEGKQRSM